MSTFHFKFSIWWRGLTFSHNFCYIRRLSVHYNLPYFWIWLYVNMNIYYEFVFVSLTGKSIIHGRSEYFLYDKNKVSCKLKICAIYICFCCIYKSFNEKGKLVFCTLLYLGINDLYTSNSQYKWKYRF